ncbi:hypothetical protein C8R47DRAFT_1072696 [Mycena vitilis]|nr:hypothetical protein C8R47DRAFT_1072696 [Mycena vitilis]
MSGVSIFVLVAVSITSILRDDSTWDDLSQVLRPQDVAALREAAIPDSHVYVPEGEHGNRGVWLTLAIDKVLASQSRCPAKFLPMNPVARSAWTEKQSTLLFKWFNSDARNLYLVACPGPPTYSGPPYFFLSNSVKERQRGERSGGRLPGPPSPARRLGKRRHRKLSQVSYSALKKLAKKLRRRSGKARSGGVIRNQWESRDAAFTTDLVLFESCRQDVQESANEETWVCSAASTLLEPHADNRVNSSRSTGENRNDGPIDSVAMRKRSWIAPQMSAYAAGVRGKRGRYRKLRPQEHCKNSMSAREPKRGPSGRSSDAFNWPDGIVRRRSERNQKKIEVAVHPDSGIHSAEGSGSGKVSPTSEFSSTSTSSRFAASRLIYTLENRTSLGSWNKFLRGGVVQTRRKKQYLLELVLRSTNVNP